MKEYYEIVDVLAREIINSKAEPALEVEVTLDDGTVGIASVPSPELGGSCDAGELCGSGISLAVANVNIEITEALLGLNALDQTSIDGMLKDIDGTPGTSRLGANAVLGASLAVCRAAALATGQSLYNYIGGINAKVMPVPMFGLLGGMAGDSMTLRDIQLVPTGAETFKGAVHMCSEIYRAFTGTVRTRAPFSCNEDALETIVTAAEAAGYSAGEDYYLSLDMAASVKGNNLNAEEIADMLEHLADKYPVACIEVGNGTGGSDGLKKLKERFGSRMLITAGDMFAPGSGDTGAYKTGAVNSVLLMLDNFATVTDLADAVNNVHRSGCTAIIGTSSGETEDTAIADIAVALNTGLIKLNAPGTGNSTKLNQLLRIEEELFDAARYAGAGAFLFPV